MSSPSVASSLESVERVPIPQMHSHVFRVAITGGPCGGKTTALAEVSERLRSRGIPTFVVPEAATLMFGGGGSVLDLGDKGQRMAFQTALLKTQISLESEFCRVAQSLGRSVVILSDRGAMDGRAYMDATDWSEMLENVGYSDGDLRDSRYDLVLHLVTAAIGASEFYTLANNATRTEGLAEAIAQDKRTRDAWTGHAHLRIVDNRTGFKTKINRVFNLIADLIGLPAADTWAVRKFLISSKTLLPKSGLKTFNVKQTFLQRDANTLESVRVRCDGSSRNFQHKVRIMGKTVGDDGATGTPSETKRQISNREYLTLLSHSDPERRMVSIRRSCFFGPQRTTYFIVDEIRNVQPPLRLLRCHVEKEYAGGDTRLVFPNWLKVQREVTGEFDYTVYALSLRIAPERIREPQAEPINIKRESARDDNVVLARSF